MFWIPNISTIIFAFVIQSMILAGFAWFKKFKSPEDSYNCWLIRGARGVIFIVFTGFSLVFLDTNMKFFLGVIGYGNIALHIASIILLTILSTEIIFGAVFVASNRKGVITFMTVLISFIIFWYFYLNDANLNDLKFVDSKYSVTIVAIAAPIFVGIVAASMLTVTELIMKKVKKHEGIIDKPFWNIQKKAKSFFNLKFNFILWLLITIELLLNLQGLSLLLWLTFFL